MLERSSAAQQLPYPGSSLRRFVDTVRTVFMASKLKMIFPVIVPLLVSPTQGAELTYKEFSKASETWKRGFVFGISRYMSTVAQPDEEAPCSTGSGASS